MGSKQQFKVESPIYTWQPKHERKSLRCISRQDAYSKRFSRYPTKVKSLRFVGFPGVDVNAALISCFEGASEREGCRKRRTQKNNKKKIISPLFY